MRTQANAPSWVSEMYVKVENKWKSLGGACPNSKLKANGYALFFGPVHDSCDLMIIGFNPGGSADCFIKRTSPPSIHEYLCSGYKLAIKMREMFCRIGAVPLLARSVKANLNFFRSKDLAELNALCPKSISKNLAEFCFAEVKEIIGKLAPKVIITEGLGVFNRLTKISSDVTHKISLQDGRRRLYLSATVRIPPHHETVTLIGLIHPTGARVASFKWDIIYALLKMDLINAQLL